MAKTSYAIALGSNRRHGRYGAPAGVVKAAVQALGRIGDIRRVSTIRATPALGPAGRAFANAAVLLATGLAPDALLAALKDVARELGRRRGARFVFVDCRPGLRDLRADLRPLLEDVRRFDCATLYVLKRHPGTVLTGG